MKMQFANIKSCEYIVEFHDVHLYYNDDYDEQMEYLFCFNNNSPHILNKKYLMPINTKQFVQFVKDCLEYPIEQLDKEHWELNVIQLVGKYSEQLPSEVMHMINIKLGSLILSQPTYKSFPYLKKIEKQFTASYKLMSNEDTESFSSQICWLLIMINNLVSVSKIGKTKSHYKSKKPNEITNGQTGNFDLLDFIFDYWS